MYINFHKINNSKELDLIPCLAKMKSGLAYQTGLLYLDINGDLIFENDSGEWFFADDEIIGYIPFWELNQIEVDK